MESKKNFWSLALGCLVTGALALAIVCALSLREEHASVPPEVETASSNPPVERNDFKERPRAAVSWLLDEAKQPGAHLPLKAELFAGAHVDAIAQELREGRQNIFFDLDFSLQRALALDDKVVERVLEILQTPPMFEIVEHQTSVPENVSLKRMSMIDFLEALGKRRVTEESAEGAIGALHAMVTGNLPRELNGVQKVTMVAEKYDAVVSLSRLEPNLGAKAIKNVDSPAAQDVLYPALLTGLIDRGVEREQVDRVAQDLLAGG